MWQQKHKSLLAGLAFITALWCAVPVFAADVMELPGEVRTWFRNPDGSCVQCSIGMTGVWNNVPAATTLLWDTEYGKAVRGGSWPGRVRDYCEQRGIRAYNVTGESFADTAPWMEWAARTGRFAAIGAGRSHFQTEYGRDATQSKWFVCNNNSPQRIDEYTEAEYRRLHESSGAWVVILAGPACPAPPRYVRWW